MSEWRRCIWLLDILEEGARVDVRGPTQNVHLIYINNLNEINPKLTSVDVVSLGFAFGSSKHKAWRYVDTYQDQNGHNFTVKTGNSTIPTA